MTTNSRISEAKSLSEEILGDIELNRIELVKVLLKAKRLARLLNDTDAQEWINLELTGYPCNFLFSSLQTCEHYFIKSTRVTGDKYWPQSISDIVDKYESDSAILNNLQFPSNMSPSLSSSNQYEHVGDKMSGIIKGITQDFGNMTQSYKHSKNFNYKLIIGITAALYNYVSDINIALSFGDIVSDEFEIVRIIVDKFIQKNCPKSVEQLTSIFDRARERTEESYSQALVSCRRILMSVADSIFPAQDENYIDLRGNSRKVGQEEYKNRLMAFLEQHTISGSTKEIYDSQINHLAARLDAVYEKSCKGVHNNICESEAMLAIVHTYLFIAEIGRVIELNQQ